MKTVVPVTRSYELFRSGFVPWVEDMDKFQHRTPDYYDEVEIMREEWECPQRVTVARILPQMNAAGLYWRPVGWPCPDRQDHAPAALDGA